MVARGDALLAPSVTRSLILPPSLQARPVGAQASGDTAGAPDPPGRGPLARAARAAGRDGRRVRGPAAAPAPGRPLTGREREVVTLVAAGLSNDEIAARLVVSPLTAKTHVSRAMIKLDARDRAQLVVRLRVRPSPPRRPLIPPARNQRSPPPQIRGGPAGARKPARARLRCRLRPPPAVAYARLRCRPGPAPAVARARPRCRPRPAPAVGRAPPPLSAAPRPAVARAPAARAAYSTRSTPAECWAGQLPSCGGRAAPRRGAGVGTAHPAGLYPSGRHRGDRSVWLISLAQPWAGHARNSRPWLPPAPLAHPGRLAPRGGLPDHLVDAVRRSRRRTTSPAATPGRPCSTSTSTGSPGTP